MSVRTRPAVTSAPLLTAGGDLLALEQRYFDASRPEHTALEMDILERIVPRAAQYRFIDKRDFLQICEWISPDVRSSCEWNSPQLVESQSAQSLRASAMVPRIAPFLMLEGMTLPVASTFVHFLHEDYPRMSVAALRAVGIARNNHYKVRLWQDFVDRARIIARRTDVSMRTLDRAIVQFARENPSS